MAQHSQAVVSADVAIVVRQSGEALSGQVTMNASTKIYGPRSSYASLKVTGGKSLAIDGTRVTARDTIVDDETVLTATIPGSESALWYLMSADYDGRDVLHRPSG